MREPALQKMLSQEGADPLTSTPEQFQRTIAADIKMWAEVIRAAGIKFE